MPIDVYYKTSSKNTSQSGLGEEAGKKVGKVIGIKGFNFK